MLMSRSKAVVSLLPAAARDYSGHTAAQTALSNEL
jgi:hypothetical protein